MNRLFAIGTITLLLLGASASISANGDKAAKTDDAPADKPEAAETPDDLFNSGISALVTGQYAAARRFGKKLSDAGAASAPKGLWLTARADRESGDPAKSLKAIEDNRAALDSDPRLQVEYIWLLLGTGRYADAETAAKTLAAKGKDSPVATEAGAVLGESLWLQGRYDEARPILDAAAVSGQSIQVAEKAPDDYMLADRAWHSGWAAYRIDDLHTAQSRWEVGRRAHRRHAASYASLARIFLESNKDASARQNYCELVYGNLMGAGFNPNHAESHFIGAQTYLVRWNQGAATAEMQKALKLNPFHVEALATRGAFLIHNDQYEEGLKLIARALAVNPNSAAALGAKALWAGTLAKKDDYAALEAKILSVNKAPGEFYQIVADGLAGRHRYDEAIAVYRKGIEKQPKLWTLHRELGRALLNTGETAAGEESLKTAQKNDVLRNTIFTVNLLALLDTYKYFKRFSMVDGKFSVLVYEDETDIVAPYYERELTATAKELTAKYDGFSPKWPVKIEAFHRHKDFEVRTVGIEGLPALGACFGQLITLDSPSARDPGTYNWASTLRHEMDHVYQLQMSNGQIPRWLAEGCSVYEERRCRPEWERHMEDQLFQHYATNALPKVSEFNTWFGDGSRVLFAYYLGSIMVEFIVNEYGGYAPVITMIRDFAAKKTPEEAFKGTLKIDTDEFDKKFREYVGKKVSRIKIMPAVRVDKMEELQIRAEDGDATIAELVTLARAHTQNGNFVDARMWAGLAQKRGADTKELNYTLGMLARGDGKPDAAARAKKFFTKAYEQGLEDFQLYMTMAQYAQAEKRADDRIALLEKARDAFPTDRTPLGALYQHYLDKGDQASALLLAEQMTRLNEEDLTIRAWLLDQYRQMGDHEAAADMALQMIYVNPFTPETHRFRAEALKELAKWEDAVFEWEMYRRASVRIKDEGPTSNESRRKDGRIAAAIGKARVWMAAGKLKEARQAVLDAQAEAAKDERVIDLTTELEALEAAAK